MLSSPNIHRAETLQTAQVATSNRDRCLRAVVDAVSISLNTPRCRRRMGRLRAAGAKRIMRRILACMLMIALGGGSARTDGILFPSEVERINRCIQGQVLDFTQNHGKDRRIWSNALCAKRDLYVYLPPGYTPAKKYPLVIFLHGAGQDERMFLPMAKSIDKKIVDGKIPPMVVAIPDGAILERPSVIRMASFWANTKAGRFED